MSLSGSEKEKLQQSGRVDLMGLNQTTESSLVASFLRQVCFSGRSSELFIVRSHAWPTSFGEIRLCGVNFFVSENNAMRGPDQLLT